jgi:N-acyl-D-aspartate/D-glutamate deacylase
MIGAKPSPRTYGTYPHILGELVREERLLGLEEAVRKMSGASASRLGLADRGIVADGSRADLVVFDPARVRARATSEEPRRYPEGSPDVLVHGVVVVDCGEHTGATPGRALRRGRLADRHSRDPERRLRHAADRQLRHQAGRRRTADDSRAKAIDTR